MLTRAGRRRAQDLGAVFSTDGYDAAVFGIHAVHRALGNAFGAYVLATANLTERTYFNELQIASKESKGSAVCSSSQSSRWPRHGFWR